jgi:hypothetical protein
VFAVNGWRSMSRVVWLVLLAAGLLALTPYVAQADPLDPHLTSFEAFMDNPDLVPTVSYPFGLEAHYDDSMPGWVHGSMFEWIDGDWRLITDSCFYISCVTGVDTDPPEEIARQHDRRFRAVLYSEGDPYDSMDLVVHERRPHFDITMDFAASEGYVTTYIPNALGGTDLSTVIHDDGSVANSCNVYWNYCNAEITAGHVYYASVEDRDGNVFGVSPTYTATSWSTAVEDTADGLDLPRLGLLYASTTEVCDVLLTDPYGTHVEERTVNDQWIACDTAVTERATMEEVLRAVALTGGGVLSYLLYEKTAATMDPAFEAPHFYLPVTFPQPWPVGDISDSYMIQTRGQNAQDDTDVATGACLWWAARAGLNAREACTTMPIFFTGADVNNATTHDAQQIFAHPEWVKLNYEYGTGKAAVQNRYWYTRERPCTDTPPDEEDQCDEYPFWASEQGGPLASPLTPHLQWVNGIDNVRQGSKYAGFISKCGLRSGTSSETANASGGTAFLVIPLMPALHIPTFSVCNRD